MKLIPYLYFDGNCEEALEYYRAVFGGEIVYLDRYGTAPMEVPEAHKEKILHAQLDFGGNSIMACDSFPGHIVANGDGIVLSIGFEGDADAAAVFMRLAEEGEITMPFEKQFWGAWLGMLTDKFSKRWMISTEIHE